MIFLKKLREEDIELILKWKKNKSYLNKEYNANISFQKKWFLDIEKNKNCKYWIINSGPIKIGIADINHINNEDKSCNLECIIEDKHFNNRGILEIVIFNLINYAFNEISMENVYINLGKKNNSFNDEIKVNNIGKWKNLIDSNIEVFEHKFICIKKSEWDQAKNNYLFENVIIY